MAHELKLSLLGGFQLILDKVDLTPQLHNKAQGLIVYLAVEQKPVSRQMLAGLFWPDTTEENALRSLRVELAKIRPFLAPYLTINRPTIGWNSETDTWIDVVAFEYLLKQSKQDPKNVLPSRLHEATNLYGGEFLAGLAFHDAVDFEAWVLRRRENLQLKLLDALANLIAVCIEQRDYATGIEYARRLLALNSLREDAHQQLMWLLVQNGQRTEALAQYETCRQILRNELKISPGEEIRKLYDHILQMAEAPTQPIRPLPQLPSAVPPLIPFLVPPDIPYFTGRNQEVATLQNLILQPPTQLPRRYCLTGLGGIGKTSLANKVAHELRPFFPDGVLWATVAHNDPAIVAENWAAAYGYDFTGLPDFNSQAEALRHVLSQKQVLLILDDVATAASIRPLLPESPHPVVLFTTRKVEQAHQLQAQVIPVEQLKPEDGRLLLHKILGSDRVNKEPGAADTICHLLHYHPLALAIVAQRLVSRPHRKLMDVAAQLQNETARLDLQLENRAVRASFAISWKSLDAAHQHTFNTLALFEGRPFSHQAVAAILQTNLFDTQEQLDYLVSLSLLNSTGEQRYAQHPLLADFAHEQLQEADTLYQTFIDYFLAFATTHQHQYTTLRPEWDNLAAAIHHAHRLHRWQTILDFTQVLKDAWFTRGRYSQARQAYQKAYQAAMALEDETQLANTLLAWGHACLEQSDHQEARKLLLQSLSIFQETQQMDGLSAAQCYLARIALDESNHEEAKSRLEESGRLSKKIGNLQITAESLYRQSRLAHSMGEFQTALEFGKQTLALEQSRQNPPGIIRALRQMASVTDDMGDIKTTEQLSQQALHLAETSENQPELAMAYLSMIGVARTRNEFDTAHEYASKSLTLLERLGDKRSQALVLFQQCLTYKKAKLYELALEVGQKSLAIFRALQHQLNIAFVLAHIGDCYHWTGRPELARNNWLESLQISTSHHHVTFSTHLQDRLQNW